MVLAFVNSFALNIHTRERTAIGVIVSDHTLTIQDGFLQDIRSFLAFLLFLIHLSFAHSHDLLKFFFMLNSLQLIIMNFFIQSLILPFLLENMIL